ncbi:MAG: IPT/TIG domain-containing protein, partial [Patescibacteria group bacterium]
MDVNQAFGGDTGQNAETLAANAGLGTTDFRLVIARIINIALGFLGIIAVSLIIYAGWLWMSAAGNEKQIETAKKIMQAAAIGLVIILSAFGIAAFVMRVLLGATGGGGTSEVCMTVSETRACGCGGAQTCSSEKTWGACIGSNCSGLPETFGVSKIKPPENIPDAAKMPKNTRINIYFNLPVDENSVSVSTIGSGKIEVKKDGTILTNANIGYEISGSQITLTSKGTCAANSCGAAGCFEPGIYSVEVKAGSVQTSAGITNKGVQGYTTTPGSFTIIDSVDCQDPKINLISNNTQICLNSDNNISANASDDSGVTDVTYSDSNDGSAFTGNKVKENSPYDIIWRPTETKGYKAMSAYTISGKATDVVGRTADNSITKTLRAEHCCNGLQDGDEKGLDCGGADCAACAAAVCGNDVKQCAANNDACASGVCKLASDGKDCLCQDVPIIDYLNPEDGAPGNLTVIGGRFFGATAGKIYFCKTVKPSGSCDEYIEAKLANAVNSQCTGAWQTNKIFAIVPANAISGPVKVEAANGFTDESNDGRGSFNKIFTINNIKRPGLCKVEPAEAEFDKTVTLHGIQLGATAARENILFGNAVASVPSARVGTWTDKKIDGVGVPNMTAGKTTISILQNKIRSNFLEFKILPNSKTPFITKIEPVAGHAGDYVTIYGGNFGKGDNKDVDKVLFGTIEADMTFPAECTKENLWQADKILVKVPADVNGNLDIKVQVSDGAKSSLTATSPNKFLAGDYCRSTYAACGSPECGDCVKSAVPGICKLDPDNGPVGASVNIYGERLGSNGAMQFNKGTKSIPGTWTLTTDTAIKDKTKAEVADTNIPAGLTTNGKIEIKLFNAVSVGSNFLPFNISSCIDITNACVGTEVCCPAASNFAGSCLTGTKEKNDCGLVPAKTYSQYYIEFSTA